MDATYEEMHTIRTPFKLTTDNERILKDNGTRFRQMPTHEEIDHERAKHHDAELRCLDLAKRLTEAENRNVRIIQALNEREKQRDEAREELRQLRAGERMTLEAELPLPDRESAIADGLRLRRMSISDKFDAAIQTAWQQHAHRPDDELRMRQTRPHPPRMSKPSKDRILQISNDVSEEYHESGKTDFATKAELCETIRYWQDRCDEWNNLHQTRMMELAHVLGNHTQQPHP